LSFPLLSAEIQLVTTPHIFCGAANVRINPKTAKKFSSSRQIFSTMHDILKNLQGKKIPFYIFAD